MAAPHVAGGSALVLQRVDEQFNLDGFDRSKLAKTFLLKTQLCLLSLMVHQYHRAVKEQD